MSVIKEFLEKKSNEKTYLFDLDHVLTKPDKQKSAYERRVMGEFIKIMTVRKNKNIPYKKAAKKLKVPNDLLKEIEKIWLKVNKLNSRIIPALKTISRKNYSIVVATNNTPDISERFLKYNKIEDYFSKIFAPEDMGMIRKPDKKYFLHISDDLDIPIESLILVDDDPKNIKEVKKIGGKGILYNSSSSYKF